MFALGKFLRPKWALLVFLVAGLAAAQDSTPPSEPQNSSPPASPSFAGKRIGFDAFIDSVLQQERRVDDLMRTYNPIIETYIQEDGSRPRFQAGITPNGDDYFLSRLSLTSTLSTVPFADEQTWKRTEEYFVQEPAPFSQLAFAQALFPDLDHFDRENYAFQFVRWEILGEVRCAVVDVTPRANSKARGFVGRIWAEDQDHNIVRFTGTFTKGSARRAFHFDSWRLNTNGSWWMPAYVYTEESNWPYPPNDQSSSYDPRHRFWFRAQTRVWGYDPKRLEAQDLRSISAEGDAIYPPDATLLERSQAAGLMAPDGDVNRILETVLNNLLITNHLDIADLRCRVLLTTPLEAFVMGHTIVLSRGLLDVLPDEATLAAVLAHELAHIVLGHPVNPAYLTNFALPFPDSQIFVALNFHFDHAEEKEADKKALDLFSKSPYAGQLANVSRFLQTLDANSARFPNLLHGRFSNDFGSSLLPVTRVDSSRPSKMLAQFSALPLGSRIAIDPWSDRITMLNNKPVRITSPAEKIPFQVTPFYPHLKRLDVQEKASGAN